MNERDLDPLVFVGTANADGRVIYELPAKVRSAHVSKRFTGKVVEIEIREFQAKRSARQNRCIHGMCRGWALERGWEIDALKQFLLKKVFGVLEFVDPQTGEVVEVLKEPHTSKLKVSEFCHLVERTMELAAYDGVDIPTPAEYKRAKEAAAKQAARERRKAEKQRHVA
jgi:hypothetical protein